MEDTVEAARPAETPSAEGAQTSLPATLGDRLLGQAVDGLLALGLFFLLGMVLAGRFGGMTGRGFQLTGLPALILLSLLVLVMLAYFVLAEAFFGVTLGKIVAEAQVRSGEGRPIDMKASLIRNLMRVVDALPFFPLYLVGAFAVILSGRGLRLGDIAAGTRVVRKPQSRAARAGALGAALVLACAGVWGGFALQGTLSLVPSTTGAPVSATLAASVSPHHEAIDPTTTFLPETPVIHVAFRVSQAQPGARLKAVWTAVDVGAVAAPNSQLAESTVVLPGPAPGNFRFSRGPQPWPVGQYRVDLYLNDQLVLSLPYRISR